MSEGIDEIEEEMKKVAQPLATLNIDKESRYAIKNLERFAEFFSKMSFIIPNGYLQYPLLLLL